MRQRKFVACALALFFCLISFTGAYAEAYTPSVAEKQLLGLVNTQRLNKKISLLTLDVALSECARKRAEDYLTTTGYPDKAPTLGTITEQLENASIQVSAIAQNLARTTSSKAVAGWRGQYILDTKYTHAGVGIATSGSKTMIVLLLAAYGPPMSAASPTPAPASSPTHTPTPAASGSAAVSRKLDGLPNAMEIALLKAINAERVSANVEKYLIDRSLMTAAQNRAWVIADSGNYKTSASAVSLENQLKAYKISYTAAAQCLLHGKSDAEGAIKAIFDTPVQKGNLLSTAYKRVGAGVASISNTNELIFVIYYINI